MNFLAHLFLSPNNQNITFGNFIADSVKGKQFQTYNIEIQQGILLHRSIDEFTDHHPVFKKSKSRIYNQYGRYSGVIVDIFYDHFLAKHWTEYSDEYLKSFVRKNYILLIQHFHLLPKRSKYILPFMISQNWLVNYANFDSLERVFKGMDRRTNHKSGMSNAVSELKKHYAELESDFHIFFPELIEFSNDCMQKFD